MQDITTLARLAQLELTEAECRRMESELGEFLNYMSALPMEEGSIDAVSEAEHPFREDVAAASMERSKLLANAPVQVNGFFVAPKEGAV